MVARLVSPVQSTPGRLLVQVLEKRQDRGSMICMDRVEVPPITSQFWCGCHWSQARFQLQRVHDSKRQVLDVCRSLSPLYTLLVTALPPTGPLPLLAPPQPTAPSMGRVDMTATRHKHVDCGIKKGLLIQFNIKKYEIWKKGFLRFPKGKRLTFKENNKNSIKNYILITSFTVIILHIKGWVIFKLLSFPMLC